MLFPLWTMPGVQLADSSGASSMLVSLPGLEGVRVVTSRYSLEEEWTHTTVEAKM